MVARQQLQHCSIFRRQRSAFVDLDVCSPFILVRSGICFDLGPPGPGLTWEIGPSFRLVNIKWLLQGDVFVHKHRTGSPCLP